jgi:HAMP domain-containing protein
MESQSRLAEWLMLALSLVVVGCLAFILRWFFRRLRRIERERWGDAAPAPPGRGKARHAS